MQRIANRYRLSLILLLITGFVVAAPRVMAAEMGDHATSLSAIPSDVAFYAAWLKNHDQYEAMLKTNAWKKFSSIPVLQMGWMQVQTQWQYPTDPQLVAFKKWFNSAEGKEVYATLIEMVSDEVFFYGDKSVTTVAEVLMEINSQSTRLQFEALRNPGEETAEEDNNSQQEKFLELIKDKADDLDLEVPTVLFGFRIKDTARATQMLDVAYEQLRKLMLSEEANVPAEVVESLERKQVSGREVLTLTLTEEMIDWSEIEAELEESPELIDMLRELAEGKQVVLSIAVVDGFVLVGMSDSLEVIEDFGKEDDSLAEQEKFQRLDRHAGERVIALAYASDEFIKAVGSNKQSFGDLAAIGKGVLSMSEIPEDQIETIEKDIDEMLDKVLDYLPEPGAIASTTFTTDRGYETFQYSFAKISPSMIATEPLTLINNVGEDSLGWVIGRAKHSTKGYDQIAKWFERGFHHIETVAEAQSSEEDWDEYQELREKMLPLVERMDAANRKYIVPGFMDGQVALVFNATAADVSWFEEMPAAETQLPLPTLALVHGVSDASAVKQGAAEYMKILQDLIALAHQLNPDEVPDYEIPEAKTSTSSAGTRYSYEFPSEWGVNERLAPNAGLNDSVLVLSILPELTETLLAGSRPKIEGPLAQFDRPLTMAIHFKFAQFIDMLGPWIDYGIKTAIDSAGEEGSGAVAAIGFVKPQVDQFIEVLKVFKDYTAVVYHEEGALVTHAESHIIDLED